MIGRSLVLFTERVDLVLSGAVGTRGICGCMAPRRARNGAVPKLPITGKCPLVCQCDIAIWYIRHLATQQPLNTEISFQSPTFESWRI